uniref:Ig-like domain-containing protein n=1 Tax=Myripristis murdjan TaxID=586833 RepID=A0A667WW24_9TELE
PFCSVLLSHEIRCTAAILVTQTPESLIIQPGDSATISCKTGCTIGDDLAWYHQKPGGPPKFIMTFDGNSRLSGTPSRFSAAGSGRDFTLTITGVQAEDAGAASLWYTFGGGTKLIVKTGVSVPPSLALLPPSAKQLKDESTATLVCLLSGYSPQGATVSWTVDGRAVTNGVVTGEEVEKDGGKSARSSTLTLSKALWEQGELYSCKASHDGRETAAELRRTECRV